MLTQFANKMSITSAHYIEQWFFVPHRSYPISNESAKEMKENEFVNLRLMLMKEFMLPFQYLLKSNASHKLKNH